MKISRPEPGMLGSIAAAYNKFDHFSKAATVAAGLSMPIDVPKVTAPDTPKSASIETVGAPPAEQRSAQEIAAELTAANARRQEHQENIIYHEYLDKQKMVAVRDQLKSAFE